MADKPVLGVPICSRCLQVSPFKTDICPYCGGVIARADEIDNCIARIINSSTADVVEVVRCKDCKYCDSFPNNSDAEMPFKCTGIRYGGVNPDWFCEHGKRREKEDG